MNHWMEARKRFEASLFSFKREMSITIVPFSGADNCERAYPNTIIAAETTTDTCRRIVIFQDRE
jgi:hypothetical protein